MVQANVAGGTRQFFSQIVFFSMLALVRVLSDVGASAFFVSRRWRRCGFFSMLTLAQGFSRCWGWRGLFLVDVVGAGFFSCCWRWCMFFFSMLALVQVLLLQIFLDAGAGARFCSMLALAHVFSPCWCKFFLDAGVCASLSSMVWPLLFFSYVLMRCFFS